LRDTFVRELSGTEGAASPFFSPDAEWVGFHAEGELRRVPITGGRPTLICRAPEAVGASWGTNGSIVFGTLNEGLFQVSVAAGGTPSRLSKPESQGESHVYPEVLPDHRTVLFTVVPVDRAVSRIGVLSLDRPGEWQSLIDGFKPSYSPTGHLLFARPAALMAAPFDLGKRRISAEPAVVIPQLSISQGGPGDASYEISAAGRLIFLTGNPLASSRLVWVDRQGREVPAVERQEAGYLQPAISPTGNRLAMSRRQGDGDTRVWTYDLADGRSVPVVLGSSLSTWPVWSPDGKWIAFVSNRAEGWNVFRAPADGSGHAEQLTFDPLLRTTPTSWSVDDVLALERGPIGHRDILVLSMGKGSKPEPLVATEAHEHGARFSPDGRWLAFNSDRSGQDEVWVKAFPGNDSPVPISIGGGREPVWSRNGRELFYRNGNRMVSVPVTAGRPGKPTVLFEGDYSYGYLDWTLNYDVAADGRFLMVKEGPAPKLHVIVNWTEELKRLVPVN
jgi:dipeptidyl aminopeptidase/acylaminoacyl peptidase